MREKELLDRLVSIYKESKKLEKVGDIELCHIFNDGVHVYSGIESLAKASGAELIEISRPDLEYQIRKFFIYQGIEFFELMKDKEN